MVDKQESLTVQVVDEVTGNISRNANQPISEDVVKKIVEAAKGERQGLRETLKNSVGNSFFPRQRKFDYLQQAQDLATRLKKEKGADKEAYQDAIMLLLSSQIENKPGITDKMLDVFVSLPIEGAKRLFSWAHEFGKKLVKKIDECANKIWEETKGLAAKGKEKLEDISQVASETVKKHWGKFSEAVKEMCDEAKISFLEGLEQGLKDVEKQAGVAAAAVEKRKEHQQQKKAAAIKAAKEIGKGLAQNQLREQTSLQSSKKSTTQKQQHQGRG